MNFKILGESCQQKSVKSLLRSPEQHLDQSAVDYHQWTKALTYISASRSYLKSQIQGLVSRFLQL